VLLSRAYATPPRPERMMKDAEQLMAAARRWREEVVPKVAAQAQSKGPRDLS